MARRTANRLYVEDIDEVSSVDIPANQHGLIAIAKRAGEPMDEYFDADGNPIDAEDIAALDPGETVYDADGHSFTVASDEDIEAALEAGQISEDDIVDLDDEDDFDDDREPELVGAVGKRGRRGATVARGRGAPGISGGVSSETEAGRRTRRLGEPGGRMAKRSTGAEVLAELRKAMTDADRDEVFAKALDRIGDAEARAERAERLVATLAKRYEADEYTEIAKSYDALPVEATELGGLLAKAASHFSKRELATLERILEVAQDGGDFDEIGYTGYRSSGSGIHDEISAMAAEVVGKSGGQLTHEQAVVALYEANPEAYDMFDQERYAR